MQALNMGSSVNNIVSFALLVVVTYVGTAAAMKVVATFKEKYKRKLKQVKSEGNQSKEVETNGIKQGLCLANPVALCIGIGRDVVSDFYGEKNPHHHETQLSEKPAQSSLNRDDKTADTENQPAEVARKLIDDLIRACTEARKDRNLKRETGFTSPEQYCDLPSGRSDSLSPSDDADQTGSDSLTSVSSLVTCDSDCSSGTSSESTSTECVSESDDGETTKNDPVATAAYDKAGPSCAVREETAGQLQEAITTENEKECTAVGPEQQVEIRMESCTMQTVEETFTFQQSSNVSLEALADAQNRPKDSDEMLFNNDRNSSGVDYDLQLMAMEEEMRRNEEEIAKTSVVGLDDNAVTDGDEETPTDGGFSGPMAPILEEEEEETDSLTLTGQATDNVVTSDVTSPATEQTDTQVKASSTDDKDDSCQASTNTKCANCDGVLAVAVLQNSVNKSPNIVVTKADVHAENTDGVQRAGGFDCVTCCSQSLSNGVCVSAGACRHNNGGGDGSDETACASDGDCAVSGELIDQSVESSSAELNADQQPVDVMGQCAAVEAENVDKESKSAAGDTSEIANPEQGDRSGLTDLHGSTRNDNNTSPDTSQQRHALVSLSTPRNGEKSDEVKLSESKTAEFFQVETVPEKTATKEAAKSESPDSKGQADVAKIRPSSFEFFGVRPKESTPTACSLTAQIRCLHTGSHNGDKLAVVEDGDTCDLEVFVKMLEGLALGKTKIYVKISLEHEDPNYKRIKRKTKAVKCTSSLQLSKRIVLPNLRRKILTQGRLVVAVWSKSSVGTNSPVCKCDLDMAKQHKFYDGKGGVMTFAQKLATDKKVWNNVTLYMS